MFNQKEVTSWMLSRFTTTSGNSRKSDRIVNARIVKKKHERYSTLYELPLPENVINNIYGFLIFAVIVKHAKATKNG